MHVFTQPSWLNPRIEIKVSPIAGAGMFAKERLQTGEIAVIFGGSYADTEGAQEAIGQGKGVMQWDDDLWSIEVEGDDPVYSINHSCDPNVWMQDAYTLIARTDIQPGAEITADYALWEADEDYVSQWECHCGGRGCRGSVTGKDWQSRTIQQAYQGHFSPLINKRIRNSGH
jgi:uncharacterized protein